MIEILKSNKKKIIEYLKITVELIIFLGAIFFIHKELKRYNIHDLKNSIEAIPFWAITLIVFFVCLDYFILTCFDILAFKNENYSLPKKNITFVSFISFAFANSIGLSGLTASGLRLNLYSVLGVPYKTIMNVVIFCYASFWLGLLWVGGIFLTFLPVSLIGLKLPIKLPMSTTVPIGILLLIGAIIFTGVIIKRNKNSNEILINRILIALADWICLSFVLYFALPPEHRINFFNFLAIFIIAQILGFLSNVPGGIGVFDLIFLTLLGSAYSTDKIIGALLIYRIAYFFIPLVVALTIFIIYRLFSGKFNSEKPTIESPADEKNNKTEIVENPTDSDLEKCISLSSKTDAYLSLLGDKEIIFDDSKMSFIMFGKSGRSFIAMGDPIGDEKTFGTSIWKFYNHCKNNKKETVFYEIGKEYLNYYLDVGLSFLKIGEFAQVHLDTFTLIGNDAKPLRHATNRVEKEGYTFEVIPRDKISEILDELESISDEWLKDKNAKEKGFSLGKFNKDYLLNFPVGVLKKDEKIMAFGNILETKNKEEISLDLMRYRNESVHGTMDYFFLSVINYGKENGFKKFNLGMAPLAGIEDNTASFWNKVENAIFSHGEHFYNFKGLRAFKDKFNPQWEPRYIAYSGPFNLPSILKDVTLLISGGVRGLISKK
ncbi:phosphatidylglycerol lysyltransferase domain-containing protein [Candidatus Cetobacterium colombiensis]|uniref:Phosphatidylglycerol lysyltransferase domain-containing protein n=1 Tax=Candidatus Cetobacterium colombiensis TaxID=3073100 RepID=A0ABU4W908_9FUSO|nr:phosphatidylglycerol lysyltransferase domain-containing protein [Candidatus Cetobacterium colombiensis]MDX8336001.1 phosphatidylglycerol lysyltransferase domain-containing protein [Candidatus Cetobacterium colombiensis]